MGKASKKVKRQAQKKVAERNLLQCQPQEDALKESFVQEDYAKVLELLADLIQAGDVKPDLLYKGAYSYFMLGDYERAAQWINNTLSYDNHHVDARILLARLCFMQNRHDEGLALYNFLIKNYRIAMSQTQKEQIMDSAEYYVRREGEKIRKEYPELADFLQVDPLLEQKKETAHNCGNNTTPAGTDALSALQRLKAKLKAVQNDAGETVREELLVDDNKGDETKDILSEGDVEKQIIDIEERTCSLRDKLRILNQFAAAQYAACDYQGAEKYLKKALQIDAGDVQSLRNMAMTQAALKDLNRAQAFAAKLPEVDFVLLYMLKEQADE